MPRAPFLCLTIVAAFPLRLFAAGPTVVMAPVSSATLAVARTVGIEPAQDRARFLADFIRLAHGGPETRTSAVEHLTANDAVPGVAGAAGATGAVEPLRVMVPLNPDVWSAAVFKRRVPIERLVSTILLDRRASLLAAGLATLDDETLAFISDHPAVLTHLYERSAPIVAAFIGSLRVHDGQIVPPGGPDAVPVWEGVVGAPVSAPEAFVAQLYAEPGRVAYIYDTIAEVEPGTAAFALSASTPDLATRVARLRSLSVVAAREYREWKPDLLPYSRAMNDLALLLARLRVSGDGTPAPPADRAFWTEVWGPVPGDAGDNGLIDVAWLAEATSVGNMYERGDRLEQLAFAQRVFADIPVAAWPDAVAAVRAFPRLKMLMLTLERMGLRGPALYASVSRQALALDVVDGTRGFVVMAQLQSSLAIVSRMTMSGAIDARRAESLVRGLFSATLDDRGRFAGAIARWLTRDLEPILPGATDVETRLMLAMAGPMLGDRAPRIEWEGGSYRVDLAFAEEKRLHAVREKQGGYTVEFALTIERLAARLTAGGLDADGLATVQRDLGDVLVSHAAALQGPSSETLPPGVSAGRRGREVIEKVLAELGQASRARDVKRAARQAGPLIDLADAALGESLLSLAYAADIGDPAGAALLTRNVAMRHDFGFGRHEGEARDRVLWSVPRQDFQPGVPWHVIGAAIGLDIALARLSLTRINADRVATAPHLQSTERDGFAVGLALMNPRRLEDATRDSIADALARGGRRIEALAAGRAPLEPIATALRLDPLRQRSVALAVSEDPSRVPDLITLSEQLVLGGMVPSAALDPWGASGLQVFGCPCTRFLMPTAWKMLWGRPQTPFAAGAVPDLNLRIAAVLAELQLPAVLAKPVLASAVEDFIQDATPMDGSDWWALSRAARAVSRQRVEDYVAAVASIDGALVPIDETESARDP